MEFGKFLIVASFCANALAAPMLVDAMTASVDRQVLTFSDLWLDMDLRAAMDGAKARELKSYSIGEIEAARDMLIVELLFSEAARVSGTILVSENEVSKEVEKIVSRIGKLYGRDAIGSWVRRRLFFMKFADQKKENSSGKNKITIWLTELSKEHQIKKFELNMAYIAEMLEHNDNHRHPSFAHSKA